MVRKLLKGGADGNEQLTSVAAILLVVALAVEGATLLNLQGLLNVHAFVGMLLLPIVGLKLGSTAWRMGRYYLGGDEYVRRGPPHVALRMLVGPVLVASTIVLFGTGVLLLALDRTQGTIVGLHKASFVVWVGAAAIHVLAHLREIPRALARRVPGLGLRLALAAVAVLAGLVIAVGTLPGADHLQDHMTGHAGVDGD
jgi:hypothetical protein